MAKTKKAIFSIQDEPPVWPDDDEDDLDLESASSDQDADEVESPVGAEGEDELDDNELEIKPRSGKSEPAKVDTKNDSDDDDEDDDGDDGLNVVTPIQPSTKFTTSRHDTIIGRARPEMAAAAAAASKTSTSQHHDPKDNRENDVDDDDDDDDWVDPIKPSSPVTAPTEAAVISEHNKTSSSNGPVSSESSDAGSRRGRGDEASVTPRPTSAVQPITSPSLQQPRQRPAPKDLPAIPTTIVSMSRQPSSRPSSASRRLSQVAISDAPVPFPTRASDHRKHSSASSRSATPSSDPVSPVSSSASQHPGHSTSNSTSTSNSHPYIHHRQPPSIAERDATGYPFPGSTTDESEGTSSDSGPSSDAWGGDEKLGTRGSLVPKRERRTTVGRTAAHSPAVVPTPIPTVPLAPSGNGNSQPQNTERLSSIGKAKHGGRTTGGAIRAVWNDEDGDDF
jgi:cysteine protease ATG4